MSGLLALFALAVVAFAAFLALVMVVKNVLYVCEPNEVLIFSGRARTTEGREVGYRIVKGGRALRVPLFETVDRMDLTNMIIEITVRGAYSKGGIPLMVQGVANIKIPGEEPLIHNTLERFLGFSRSDIMQIAQQTLEGNLRGVLARLTPEQVNQDKEAFARMLTEEAEHDLNKIGLVLDTLKIQNVSDEVGYLSSIGRMRSAQVRRDAQVAEAGAKAEAEEAKWHNNMLAELSKIEAQIAVSRKENERRIADATTRREAMIAEERAAVQAMISQARAEVQMQTARIEQVKLQLQADVIQPADAKRRRDEENAKGDAAKIIEQGRATATVLASMATQYRESRGAGRDVLLVQKLVPILRRVAGPLGELHVDRLTVIGKLEGEGGTGAGGSGSGSGGGSGSLASKLVRTTEEVRAATGLDLPELVRSTFGSQRPPASGG